MVKRISRILVPTDFSEPSKRALKYATDFAQTQGAELVLVHVLEIPVYPVEVGIGAALTARLAEDMKPVVNRELERLRQHEIPAGIPSRTLLREGQAAHEICEAAKETGADLIVIATHGYSGVQHLLMGSTAEKVVRKAPCPVLVVK